MFVIEIDLGCFLITTSIGVDVVSVFFSVLLTIYYFIWEKNLWYFEFIDNIPFEFKRFVELDFTGVMYSFLTFVFGSVLLIKSLGMNN